MRGERALEFERLQIQTALSRIITNSIEQHDGLGKRRANAYLSSRNPFSPVLKEVDMILIQTMQSHLPLVFKDNFHSRQSYNHYFAVRTSSQRSGCCVKVPALS